jgi:hypothetical protein
LPLLPLGFGHYYAATAACLLVAVPYIKAGKLTAIIHDLNEKFPAPRATAAETEVQRLEKKRRFWRYLTLSPVVPSRR